MAEKVYETEVNEGGLSMGWLERKLNDRWHAGWALHSMLDKDGNLVMVFVRR